MSSPNTNSPPNQTDYWDGNLDPANRDAVVSDATAALAREVEFARRTPDIQRMLEFLQHETAANRQRDLLPAEKASGPAIETEAIRPPLVLDIGAGLGTTSVLLQERGLTAIAMDISHNRLAALRQTTGSMLKASCENRIFVVKARAEALPFRTGALDGACSRAVLIHTDIPATCNEVSRALRPGAPVAFSEVMASNPLVNVYRRTLAPAGWRDITMYFTQAEVHTVKAAFDQTHARYYYVLAFLAFVFQYAVPAPRLFSMVLNLFIWLDRTFVKIIPGYESRAWFVLITGKARQP